MWFFGWNKFRFVTSKKKEFYIQQNLYAQMKNKIVLFNL